MSRYSIRSLTRDDFQPLMRLEHTLFGQTDDGVLGPYYVRLCCDMFGDTCFLVEVDGEPVGYLLAFLNRRAAYCTTLALLPEFHGSRAILALLGAFIQSLEGRVDLCWFTVEEGNHRVRSLHRMLGAVEVERVDDFYGPGRARIVSRIERAGFERLRGRFERMGLVPNRAPAQAVAV